MFWYSFIQISIKIKGSNLKVDNVSFLIKNGNGIPYIPPIGSELSIGQY